MMSNAVGQTSGLPQQPMQSQATALAPRSSTRVINASHRNMQVRESSMFLSFRSLEFALSTSLNLSAADRERQLTSE